MSSKSADDLPDPIDAENDPQHDSRRELSNILKRNFARNAYVAIVSYEDNFVPFCAENADTLTEFFTDYNNIRTGVKSYMIYEVNEVLKKRENYVKELCNIQRLQEKMIGCKDTPVMFLFGHGSESTKEHPAYIQFSDEGLNNMDHLFTTCVFACGHDIENYAEPETEDEIHELEEHLRFWQGAVYLQDLITNTKLVFCMCCNGDAIVKDYLSERMGYTTHIPDILYFAHRSVNKSSIAILIDLVIKITDSNQIIFKDPNPDDLYKAIKSSILTIFKIVRFCGDDVNKFWDFLLEIECIAEYGSLKDKQRLPIPKRLNYHHVKDHYILTNHNFHDYINEEQKRKIFNDFKSLTLFSKNGTTLVYDSYKTVDSFPSIPNTRSYAHNKPSNLIDVWQYYNKFPRHDSRESVEQQHSLGISISQRLFYNKYFVNIAEL